MASTVRPLSSWDQVAPRRYVQQVYCFPFASEAPGAVAELRRALAGAALRLPDFAGRVVVQAWPPGRAALAHGDDGDGGAIGLRVADERDGFGFDYAGLRAAGFPARAFIGASFGLPHRLVEGDERGVPVVEVHARVIRGGLLLCIYIHHSLTDGLGMACFVAALAACTCGPAPADPAGHDGPVAAPRPTRGPAPGFELMRRCPEYCALSTPTGPLAFRPSAEAPACADKTGRIFVVSVGALDGLKAAVRRLRRSGGGDGQADGRAADASRPWPSTFACLAALTWAHATAARLAAASAAAPGRLPHAAAGVVGEARARRRRRRRLRGQRRGHGRGAGALARLVRAVEAALATLDGAFVAARTALFRAAPDPRLVGLDQDPDEPRDFIVNSWRHLGADTRWRLPGATTEGGGGGVAPDAVRRAQTAWNSGAATAATTRCSSRSTRRRWRRCAATGRGPPAGCAASSSEAPGRRPVDGRRLQSRDGMG